jgi:Uma2 family endonuclease
MVSAIHSNGIASGPAVLDGIGWETYSDLLRTFARSRRLRLTYDRGRLEIMSPLLEHEGPAEILGRFIEVLTEEFHLPCRAGGSLTLRRKAELRGLEPDKCFWIANAPRLLGKRSLDLRSDPPPDLAIEVDVTSSSIDRMSIYATLKVPEVWRLSSEELKFNALRGKSYHVQPKSLAFPPVSSSQLLPFLDQVGLKDDNALVAGFRRWVRKHRGRA